MGLLSRIPRPGAAGLRAEASEILWFHSLNLGKGVVTEGVKSRMRLAYELRALRLPDLRGRTVLDIGAWDGYFSFAAERRGAKRVVALDHYAWSMDIQAQRAYITSCVNQGLSPKPFEQVPDVWRPDELPGKRGFDLAHRCYGSSVEAVVGDFMTMDLSSLGRFDVVLYLGVLYHMQDPFAALRRVAAVTEGLAVIETDAVRFPALDDRPLCEFFPADERAGDPSNWWAPNEHALVGMGKAAGFDRVEIVHGPPAPPPNEPAVRFRAIAHAWR